MRRTFIAGATAALLVGCIMAPASAKEADPALQVTQALNSKYAGAYEIQRLEMVGPKVGADLRSKALEAMFYAVLLIAIYISGQFEKRW